MKYFTTSISLFFLFLLIVTPEIAIAQDTGGLVPCSGLDCDTCALIELINRIVNFLITLLTIAATLMLVVTGFKLVTSGGNTTAMQAAKGTFQNIIIGFIIVLAAWLFVDTILKVLTGGNQGLEYWSSVDCGEINYTESTGAGAVNVNVEAGQNSGMSSSQSAQQGGWGNSPHGEFGGGLQATTP